MVNFVRTPSAEIQRGGRVGLSSVPHGKLVGLININEQICAVMAVLCDNILQGWFKMKTTSIFPVRRLASLILMSKYAQSRQFFVGVS